MKDLPTVRQLLQGLGLTAALSGTVGSGCEGKRAITKAPPPEVADADGIRSTNPPPILPGTSPDAGVVSADGAADVRDALIRDVNVVENPPWVPDARDGPSDGSSDGMSDLRPETISVPNPPWMPDGSPDGT